MNTVHWKPSLRVIRRTLPVAAVVLAFAAGCSSSGDGRVGGAGGAGGAFGTNNGAAAGAPPAGNRAGAPAGGNQAGAPPAANPAGDDASFCAFAKAKGAQDLLALDASSDDDIQTVLANLDAIDAAAPPSIKPDFDALDKLDHAMFDSGTPDAATLQQLQNGAIEQNLQHIHAYLAGTCHIGD